jgi:hypothetical protein
MTLGKTAPRSVRPGGPHTAVRHSDNHRSRRLATGLNLLYSNNFRSGPWIPVIFHERLARDCARVTLASISPASRVAAQWQQPRAEAVARAYVPVPVEALAAVGYLSARAIRVVS